MSVLFIDGFDKYGPAGLFNPTTSSLIVAEWTVLSNSVTLASPLSSTGYAMTLGTGKLSKTLPNNYSHLVGGVRFKSDLGGQSGNGAGVSFGDGGSNQAFIRIDSGTGTISFVGYSGNTASVIQKTVGVSVKANSIHYLEWDIVFGASAAYTIYLDGVSILTGTGATNGGTGNSYANQISLESSQSGITYDDLYVFETSTSPNNAVLLTNPRIETQFPTGDSSKAFANGGAVLGTINQTSADIQDYVTNGTINLIKVTPSCNMTLNSLLCRPSSSPADNWTAVVYSDSAGSPSSLLGSSADTQGSTTSPFQVTLSLPLALTGGTPYWIGFMFKTNTAINTLGRTSITVTDNHLSGVSATQTYGTPPGTAPVMTISQPSYMFYGYCTSVAQNWVSENRNPPPGDISYISSANAGDEDLYTFPALTTTPTAIYTVAVKAYARLTDTGNRAADLRMKSNTTDSAGSNAGQIPATSYQWLDSFFDTDPNTSAAWTKSGLDAAVSGIKVAS